MNLPLTKQEAERIVARLRREGKIGQSVSEPITPKFINRMKRIGLRERRNKQ